MNYYEAYEDNFINAIKANIKKLIKGLNLEVDQSLIREIKLIFKESLKPPYKGGIYFKGRFKPEVIASTLLYFVLKNSEDYKDYFKPKNRYTNNKYKKISARKIAHITGITQASVNRQCRLFEERFLNDKIKEDLKKLELIIFISKCHFKYLLFKLQNIIEENLLEFKSKSEEIFDDLINSNPKIYIETNIEPRILAGAIFYLICELEGKKDINFLKIAEIFNDIRISFQKEMSKLFKILRKVYGLSFRELIEYNIKILFDKIKIDANQKRIYLSHAKIILEDILRPISKGGLSITANTDSRVVAGAIFYLISKLEKNTEKITFVRIGNLLEITPASVKKYYYNNFRDKYNNL